MKREKCQVASLGLLDQRLGEEQHQRNDEPVVRQRLHERQGEEQNAAEIVGELRLAADAVKGGHQRGVLEQRGRGQDGGAGCRHSLGSSSESPGCVRRDAEQVEPQRSQEGARVGEEQQQRNDEPVDREGQVQNMIAKDRCRTRRTPRPPSSYDREGQVQIANDRCRSRRTGADREGQVQNMIAKDRCRT